MERGNENMIVLRNVLLGLIIGSFVMIPWMFSPRILAQQDILAMPEDLAIKKLENDIKDQVASDKEKIEKISVDSTNQVLKKTNQLPSRTFQLEVDSFFDPNFNYGKFSGRVTDIDQSSSILKISSESKNIKFFKASDPIQFRLSKDDYKNLFCEGFVRSVEENYFILYASNLSSCTTDVEYFRRGMVLVFHSPKLQERVKEASIHRSSLLQKKKDFLMELNSINQDVWSYEEKKVQISAEFDRKIAIIQKEKRDALAFHLAKNKDHITLQKELIYRLDTIDQEIQFYRVEKDAPLYDRWHLDQNLGVPVYERPEPLRAKR